MAVGCLGPDKFRSISRQKLTSQHSCAVEINVEEASAYLPKAMKESSLVADDIEANRELLSALLKQQRLPGRLCRKTARQALARLDSDSI